jgi:hypothetical protein
MNQNKLFQNSLLKKQWTLRLRKRKLQLLPSILMRRQKEEAKAGALAYVAGEFCCLSLRRSQISKDLWATQARMEGDATKLAL